ncbi:MAG: hypothetical protein IR153_04730 [Flavobacterium sp.]|nr:hypothetical protein [Flavobacterium sp.]
MKRLPIFLFVLISFCQVNAQINELGIFLGGSNFVGDVGKTDYIAPNELAFGILYKWNRSPRHAYRISYTQSQVSGNDADSDVAGRNLRGYRFENSLKELSVGFEFNFFDFNLHELDRKITPYVYSGVSYFFYDELYVLDGATEKDDTTSALAIPMTVGIKSNITPSLVLGFEVGARYTFTDNIDGSHPKEDSYESLRFGKMNSNDWYVFTGFTLTYTFGEKPCYCAE